MTKHTCDVRAGGHRSLKVIVDADCETDARRRALDCAAKIMRDADRNGLLVNPGRVANMKLTRPQ